MKFLATNVDGVFVLEPEVVEDTRGFFARTFDASEFRAQGLHCDFVQNSISFNPLKGTLRGMHHQRQPHAETKIIRCSRGALFDVAIDLRPESPSYRRWFGAELSADNHHALYVPEGCAHGFLSLEDDTEVQYAISAEFVPDSFLGVRWDDPAFGILWPFKPRLISQRDATFPDYVEN